MEVTYSLLSTDAELRVNKWLVKWKTANRTGQFVRTLCSGCEECGEIGIDERELLEHFHRRAGLEVRLGA